jgi:hypothetical protein
VGNSFCGNLHPIFDDLQSTLQYKVNINNKFDRVEHPRDGEANLQKKDPHQPCAAPASPFGDMFTTAPGYAAKL